MRHISKLLEDSKIKLQNERDRINGMDAHNAELLAELEELRLNEIQRSGEVNIHVLILILTYNLRRRIFIR